MRAFKDWSSMNFYLLFDECMRNLPMNLSLFSVEKNKFSGMANKQELLTVIFQSIGIIFKHLLSVCVF